MLHTPTSPASQTANDREARVQALLNVLHGQAEPKLRQMAEHLADLPQGRLFGQIEHDLGDLGRAIAASAHQAGLDAGNKGAT
jgi:hypothetical protein